MENRNNPKGSLAGVWRNRTSDGSEFLQEISLDGCFATAGGFPPTLSKLCYWTESWNMAALVGPTEPLNLFHDLIFLYLSLQRSPRND